MRRGHRLAITVALAVSLLLGSLSGLAYAGTTAEQSRVEIYVFWSPECGHCDPVTERALRRLGQELRLEIQPTYVDIDKVRNYTRLVRIERLMGIKSQDLPVVLVGSRLIGGESAIRKKLRSAVAETAERGDRWSDAVGEILREQVVTTPESAKAPDVYGIYFTLAQCSHCRRPDHVVKYLESSVPGLKLRTYVKQDLETRILQEAVEERLAIPSAKRGKRPRLVIGDVSLLEDEINDADALKLVKNAEAAQSPPWVVSESERFAARKRLTRFFDSFTLGTMVVGGLLDGVNPCAFTVIIFFISYLAALGRARRELLAIGLSFVLAVFVTYLCIGLGLSELLDFLSVVPWLARAISFVVAGLAFVLAIASFYDLVLIAKGRPREIVLQLPGAIKRRINLTLARRVGGAHRDVAEASGPGDTPPNGGPRRLVPILLAAFFSGVVVSFLELACTGQIYLPAVRMMLFDASGRRLRAFSYLIVYNLAFIIPLLGVFLLAYMGVTSEQLRSWLTKHLGVTKLATAVFFTFLGVLILIIEL